VRYSAIYLDCRLDAPTDKHSLRLLCLCGNSLRYPLQGRLCGTQSHSGNWSKEEKISSVLGSNIHSAVIHNVAKQCRYSLDYPRTNKDKFTSSIILRYWPGEFSFVRSIINQTEHSTVHGRVTWSTVFRGGFVKFMDHRLVLSGYHANLRQWAGILLVSQKMSGESALHVAWQYTGGLSNVMNKCMQPEPICKPRPRNSSQETRRRFFITEKRFYSARHFSVCVLYIICTVEM
jgi:hypothetical protein